jgi:hypothetical protein
VAADIHPQHFHLSPYLLTAAHFRQTAGHWFRWLEQVQRELHLDLIWVLRRSWR